MFLDTAVSHLLSAVNSSHSSLEDILSYARVVAQSAEQTDEIARNQALHRLREVIPVADLMPAAIVAFLCGAIVEHGANPHITLDAILTRLTDVLAQAIEFNLACYAASLSSAEFNPEAEDYLSAFGAQIANEMPENAQAWEALEYLCLPAIAMLSRSSEARRTTRSHEVLQIRVEVLSQVHGTVGFLWEMLQVLDEEELLVLHPSLRRGYRVQISGIADNFQLHTLLADALIGDPAEGWIEGTRPDPRVVAGLRDQPVDLSGVYMQGKFNLVNWKSLQPDRTLSNDWKNWIWNEEVPAEIPQFEGVRIVLLEPPSYSRSWNVCRKFSGMNADLRVLEILSPQVVEDWLTRIAARKEAEVSNS